jgi:hypothetical protein
VTAHETRKKNSRLIRDLRTVQEISRDPRSIVPRARGWLAALWAANGGGFFGLGYVLAFVTLEATTLASAVSESSTSGFIVGQVVQYLLRISIDSFLNAFLALIWPVHLWRWLGAYSLVLLATGYLAFEYALRPVIERWFPGLKQARIEWARLKQEKRDAKRARRERRRQGHSDDRG